MKIMIFLSLLATSLWAQVNLPGQYPNESLTNFMIRQDQEKDRSQPLGLSSESEVPKKNKSNLGINFNNLKFENLTCQDNKNRFLKVSRITGSENLEVNGIKGWKRNEELYILREYHSFAGKLDCNVLFKDFDVYARRMIFHEMLTNAYAKIDHINQLVQKYHSHPDFNRAIASYEAIVKMALDQKPKFTQEIAKNHSLAE